MELKKYKNNNKRKSYILIIIGFLLISISTYLFYESYALYEESKNFDVINGTVEDPGDIYFAYYVDDVISDKMPSKGSGYFLTEKSSCTNNVTITWDINLWQAKLNYEFYTQKTNSRVKCTLYFSRKIYDENTLYDLSGNHYDGTFQNGAEVIKDSDGKNAISFDGNNDFVKIKEIPDIFEWNKGFTVEFEARWDALNRWSRIFDFSFDVTHTSAIVLTNYSTTNYLILGGTNKDGDSSGNFSTNTNSLDGQMVLGQKQRYKFIKLQTDETNNWCKVSLYKNNQLLTSQEKVVCCGNSEYNYNYLGKSNWSTDAYFKGLIYSLKIIDNNNLTIVNYDVNY